MPLKIYCNYEYTDKKYSYLQAFFAKKDRGDTK